jgi:dTDP-4-dehydrorhamnose 3,5-epimerase
MKITATKLNGVFDIALEAMADERGFFARWYCPDEFARAGIDFTSTQINISRNDAAGTLRGMHWQEAPHAEAKLVRCVRGRIFDIVADLRHESPTYRQWVGRELDAVTGNALFVPEGCAHGFLTLEANSDVLYQMGRPYTPGKAKGFRYDDPAFTIPWPHEPQVIAAADLAWPPFQNR